MLLQQRAIAGGAPRGMQRDQIQRRGVRGAVIRRVRDQLEMRQFAVAQLVHDLARLGVAIVVALLRLPAAQHVQRAAGELRIDQDVLQRHDQAVAAERRHEPRQAGGGHEHHVVGARDRQAQRRHVLDRLAIAAIELLVAGADLQHRLLPVGCRWHAPLAPDARSRAAHGNGGCRRSGRRAGSNARSRSGSILTSKLSRPLA